MRLKRFENEKELAKLVIAWLQDQHWEVYQEVQIFSLGSVADIVAVQNKLIWVIECKLSLGFAVLDQAMGWVSYANYVSVATQHTRTRSGMADQVCRLFGIGRLEVESHDWSYIRENVKPGLHRRIIPDQLMPVLTEAHKTYAEAGNSEGRHWTPFKATCQGVQRAVVNNPGIGIKEVITIIDHHYSSSATARSCLLKWIEAGKVEGVRMVRDGRLIKLYPSETT